MIEKNEQKKVENVGFVSEKYESEFELNESRLSWEEEYYKSDSASMEEAYQYWAELVELFKMKRARLLSFSFSLIENCERLLEESKAQWRAFNFDEMKRLNATLESELNEIYSLIREMNLLDLENLPYKYSENTDPFLFFASEIKMLRENVEEIKTRKLENDK